MSVTRGAFTLVELLITVAIVSVLVGILLPSLAGARSAARAARCMVQARQLQLANDLYAADHDDRFVPGAAEFLENKSRWHGTRQSLGEPFTPSGAPLLGYTDTLELVARTCPAFRPPEAPVGFERGSGAYGYNNAFVGTHRARSGGAWVVVTDRAGTPRYRFGTPSSTLGFADAAFPDERAAERVVEYAFAEPRFNPGSPDNAAEGFRQDPSIHFRHPGATASVVSLDGHAAPERLTFTWSSGFYTPPAEEVALGWYDAAPDADSNNGFTPD